MNPNLPAPDLIAKEHSEHLQMKIAAKIREEGPITFAHFMQMALYEPGLGYYSAGARKFGVDGDFVTAPEISPLFSQCLANQCAEILRNLSGSSILEFGAGTGVMAKDILLSLHAQQILPEKYYIVEVSADLRERQQTLLAELDDALFKRVVWLDHLPEIFSGVILANEVLDAMPVNKFLVDEKIQEFYVDYVNNEFCWNMKAPHNPALIDVIKKLPLFSPSRYEAEINLSHAPWMKALGEMMKKGVVILIDYGFPAREYYHPDRTCGTIMCHYQHRAHDNPLINVGIQDITAHVDFTAIAEAACDAGFRVEGFVNQTTFLINCGLMDLFPLENELAQYRASQEIKMLTLPSEMGELFKVMALSKDYSEALCGFNNMNQLMRL
jgi:SAM-dependent MidA family methyltransferase